MSFLSIPVASPWCSRHLVFKLGDACSILHLKYLYSNGDQGEKINIYIFLLWTVLYGVTLTCWNLPLSCMRKVLFSPCLPLRNDPEETDHFISLLLWSQIVLISVAYVWDGCFLSYVFATKTSTIQKMSSFLTIWLNTSSYFSTVYIMQVLMEFIPFEIFLPF